MDTFRSLFTDICGLSCVEKSLASLFAFLRFKIVRFKGKEDDDSMDALTLNNPD